MGRIAKYRLIQFVMQEEHQAGRKPDYQRVMLLANKRLEQYPEAVRGTVKLKIKDYRTALQRFNANPREIPAAAVHGEPSISGTGLPNSPEAFTKEELLKASWFLRFCGSSLTKAKQLLDFIYVLTRESIT